MVKLCILMVIALVLIGLFGANFSVLLGGFVSGGNMIASTLGIFLDFYMKTFGAMLKQAYIQNLLFIFLFVWVFSAIVKFIRGVRVDSVDSYDIDEDGQHYVSTTKSLSYDGFNGRKRVIKRRSAPIKTTYMYKQDGEYVGQRIENRKNRRNVEVSTISYNDDWYDGSAFGDKRK